MYILHLYTVYDKTDFICTGGLRTRATRHMKYIRLTQYNRSGDRRASDNVEKVRWP